MSFGASDGTGRVPDRRVAGRQIRQRVVTVQLKTNTVYTAGRTPRPESALLRQRAPRGTFAARTFFCLAKAEDSDRSVFSK